MFSKQIKYKKRDDNKGRYEWLNKLETKKYIMPFVIEKDNEYKKSLQAKFEFICNDIEISGAEKTFVNHVKNISGKIMNSFELYYKGELLVER